MLHRKKTNLIFQNANIQSIISTNGNLQGTVKTEDLVKRMQQLEQQLWPVTIQTPRFVELSCMYNEVIEMVYIGKKHSCTV